MQIAAYQPIVNIDLPTIAGSFSSAVAGIITFDLPYIDLDNVTFDLLDLPENDGILTDLDE